VAEEDAAVGQEGQGGDPVRVIAHPIDLVSHALKVNGALAPPEAPRLDRGAVASISIR
jgi:hypothetical protein